MFPLHQKQLPTSAEELRAALETGLRELFRAAGKIVSIREGRFPQLDEIAINLSGAELRTDLPLPSVKFGESADAFRARRLAVTGRLSFGAASLDLNIDAHEVVFHQTQNESGNVVLLIHRAEKGRILLSLAQTDLETLIVQIAKNEAAQHGVTVEGGYVRLNSSGPRALEAEVQLHARKLFVRAIIRVAARLEVDDQLVARIRNPTCTGEGTIANLACAVLAPHLQKIEGRSFALATLPLSELRLHSLGMEANDGIKIAAEFGSETEI